MRYVRQKCTGLVNVMADASGQNYIVIARQQPSGLIVVLPDGTNQQTNTIGYNRPPRFDQTKVNYEEFAVTSLKITFFPSNVTAQGSVFSM